MSYRQHPVQCLQLQPPPPSASFAQLAKTPASSLLLNEFLLHEKQRTNMLAGQFGGATSQTAPAPAAASSRPAVPQVSALLPPSQPGSLMSATPTYSQAISSKAQFRLDQYHPLDDIYFYINTLAKLYPRRVSVFTIGHTQERRPIKALELINNATDPDYVWLDALTHAREWITATTMLYTIDKLVVGQANQQQQQQHQHKIYSKNYIIVPVVNPDGYAYTWSNNRMWRKNRSKSPPGDIASKSCVGVSTV